MEKLFISQPMKGKTDEEIIHERNVAIRRAKALLIDDVQVTDSLFTADIAYFTVGWDKARGCEIEHEVCIQYGIPTIEASIVGEE